MDRVEVGARERPTVPAAPRLLRDFVNTYEPQVDRETLTTPSALGEWFALHSLRPPVERLTPQDLQLVVRIREGLREILAGHAGHPPAGTAVDDLNRALAMVPVRVEFGPDAEMGLATSRGGVDEVVCGLLAAVAEAVRDGTWQRLKVCAKSSCRWAYYDSSRNRSGRWCSMSGCGNQVKMQRAHASRRRRP